MTWSARFQLRCCKQETRASELQGPAPSQGSPPAGRSHKRVLQSIMIITFLYFHVSSFHRNGISSSLGSFPSSAIFDKRNFCRGTPMKPCSTSSGTSRVMAIARSDVDLSWLLRKRRLYKSPIGPFGHAVLFLILVLSSLHIFSRRLVVIQIFPSALAQLHEIS